MAKKTKKVRKIKKPLKVQLSQTWLKEDGDKKKIEPLVRKTKIRVIGIGGGGGSIVSELSSRIKNVSFAAVNTDRQALKQIKKSVLRFQLGQNLTYGLGTGMNWEIAQNAAQAEKEKIKKLLTGYDLCIFISCLGGGTGSGGTPVFARIARNLGNLSYGIFTLPFKFEGEKKSQIAREALEKLKPNLNTISIIPNERIFQIVERSAALSSALSAMNKNLAENLEGLIETIYSAGLINIDFADLKTVFEGRGRLTYLNSVIVPSLERNEELQKSVLSSPLYPYSIRGARGVLFNIVGEKNLLLSEVSQLSKIISDSVSPEAKIIFGVSQKKKSKAQKEGVKITLLATGCGQRVFPIKERKFKRKKSETKKVAEKMKSKVSLPPKSLKDKSSGKKKNRGKKKKRVVQKRLISFSRNKGKKIQSGEPFEQKRIEVKVRRNALELRKDTEEVEKEILEQEQKWETPTFLRGQQP